MFDPNASLADRLDAIANGHFADVVAMQDLLKEADAEIDRITNQLKPLAARRWAAAAAILDRNPNDIPRGSLRPIRSPRGTEY